MRWLLLALLAGGCYDPTVAPNVPCAPSGACPSGYTCDPSTQRCVTSVSAHDDAAIDGPVDAVPVDAAPLPFVDDFARADGAAIGNAWIEKTPSTWSLDTGRVVRADSAVSYRDNLVYRPATEDTRDVEIAITGRFTTATTGSPQIFVRLQSAGAATANEYDGYLLYVSGPSNGVTVNLGRQRGSVFVVTLASTTLSPPLDTTTDFRLSVSAVGTNPVMLRAQIDRLVGVTWTKVGEIVTTDADPLRIESAGSVGFSGDSVGTVTYDQFTRALL